MLALQLRQAQTETQAAEADLQPYIRRVDEAEAAAEKAQRDADELIAEMQRYAFPHFFVAFASRLVTCWTHVCSNTAPVHASPA